MAIKSTTIYRDEGGQVVKIPVTNLRVLHYSDAERLAIEGSQGDKVLRGYRDLESSGRLRRHTMRENISTVKRAWADEQTARFK